MNATAAPSPFTGPYMITVQGGTPPYTAVAKPVPPNPPGVFVSQGPPFTVVCSVALSTGTVVYVDVTDSSNPPQTVTVLNAHAEARVRTGWLLCRTDFDRSRGRVERADPR
jgi:hypothetical protein